MKQLNKNTKTFKLFTAMTRGEAFTPNSAKNRYGVMNLRAEASRIRQSGYVVSRTTRKAGNGVEVTEYSLGEPTRELIAAGYRAMALGL